MTVSAADSQKQRGQTEPVASGVRPWPAGVEKKGATAALFTAYKAAFDADPAATFCAGERDGLTLVIARGWHGEQLQRFVEREFDGVIERKDVQRE